MGHRATWTAQLPVLVAVTVGPEHLAAVDIDAAHGERAAHGSALTAAHAVVADFVVPRRQSPTARRDDALGPGPSGGGSLLMVCRDEVLVPGLVEPLHQALLYGGLVKGSQLAGQANRD